MDTGLYSLAYAARYLGISAEIGQMKRSYSVTDAPLTTALLLRAAQELGLKARSVSGLTWANVRSGTFPILLRLSDGSYIALLAVLDNGVLVQDPQHDGQQLVVKVSRVQEIMSGEGILLAKRAKMQEQPKKFGISWFWEILQRYRKGMGNVCLLSLLLNLLGLTAPIFMQVIIDRVLVHRSLDTLDVLLVGMVLSLIFQQAMGGVRTYLLSHLVNQMDTVLGSRLFQNMAHLLRSMDGWGYCCTHGGDGESACVHDGERTLRCLGSGFCVHLLDCNAGLQSFAVRSCSLRASLFHLGESDRGPDFSQADEPAVPAGSRKPSVRD